MCNTSFWKTKEKQQQTTVLTNPKKANQNWPARSPGWSDLAIPLPIPIILPSMNCYCREVTWRLWREGTEAENSGLVWKEETVSLVTDSRVIHTEVSSGVVQNNITNVHGWTLQFLTVRSMSWRFFLALWLQKAVNTRNSVTLYALRG